MAIYDLIKESLLESSEGSSTPTHRRPTRVGAADQIAQDLVRSIVTGVLPHGGKLPAEKELARQYGVSQPTIREAIRALGMLGLIDARHGSGVYVTESSDLLVARSMATLIQFHHIGILDVWYVRSILMHHVAEMAAEHATEEDIETVCNADKFIETQIDPDTRRAAVVTFQTAFSSAGHNPLLTSIESFLVSLIMQFQVNVYGSRSSTFWRKWIFQMAAPRHDIAVALRKRDKVKLVKAVDAYLTQQRRQFTEHPELTSARLSAAWADMTHKIMLGSFKLQPFPSIQNGKDPGESK